MLIAQSRNQNEFMTQKKLNISKTLRIQKKVKNCTEKLFNVWVRCERDRMDQEIREKNKLQMQAFLKNKKNN